MSDSDIKKEIKKAEFIPVNKMIAVESVFVRTNGKLHLPNAVGGVSKDTVFFRAKHVAKDCEFTKVGDWVVPKIDARNMKSVVLGVENLLVHEDDLVAVLRNRK